MKLYTYTYITHAINKSKSDSLPYNKYSTASLVSVIAFFYK